MVNLLTAAHQLACTQYPAIWLCESCEILWMVIRAVRSGWVRAGVLLVLCGLMLNGLVTAANAGTMPVVGMPSTVHPLSPMWQAATSKTRLPYLADQARLGMFSIGDLVMLFGGSLILVICLHRAIKYGGRTDSHTAEASPGRDLRFCCQRLEVSGGDPNEIPSKKSSTGGGEVIGFLHTDDESSEACMKRREK
jgi:hypothetical protein